MRRYVQYSLVGLSAFLVALSFCVEALGFVISFSLVPFFFVLFQEPDVIRTSKLSLMFSLLTYTVLISWVTTLYPMEFLGFNKLSGLVVFVGWLFFSLMLSLPMFVALLLSDMFGVSGVRKCLVVSSLWVLMEWILEFGDMGFPWFRFSLPLASTTVFAQMASLIGSIGLSFLVVFLNACLAMFLVMYESRKVEAKSLLVWVCLVVVGSAIYGIDRTQGPDAKDYQNIDLLSLNYKKGVKVAVLQGNITSSDKWEQGSEWTHFDTYLDMSKEAIRRGAKLIVWPETALPVSLNVYDEMMEEIHGMAVDNEVSIVVGAFYSSGASSTNAIARTLRKQEFVSGLEEGLYNGLYVFPELQLYTKQHLVPIGEYMPRWMMNVLPFLHSFQLADQLSSADESVLLETKGMRIGGLICFESIFPSLSRNHVINGANVLLIASNDAWYNGSAEILQHKRHAILRAIESNRYVIRGANTGISAIIDPTGQVVSELNENTKGIVMASIRPIDEVSFYHRYPDAVIAFAVAILLINTGKFNGKRLLSLGRYTKYSRLR